MKRYRCTIVLTTTMERVVEVASEKDVYDELDDLRTEEWTELDATWDLTELVELKGGA